MPPPFSPYGTLDPIYVTVFSYKNPIKEKELEFQFSLRGPTLNKIAARF